MKRHLNAQQIKISYILLDFKYAELLIIYVYVPFRSRSKPEDKNHRHNILRVFMHKVFFSFFFTF